MMYTKNAIKKPGLAGICIALFLRISTAY